MRIWNSATTAVDVKPVPTVGVTNVIYAALVRNRLTVENTAATVRVIVRQVAAESAVNVPINPAAHNAAFVMSAWKKATVCVKAATGATPAPVK